MKKLIAILTIAIVLVGAVFADAPANGDTASLNITCTIVEVQPTLTLLGATASDGTFANADVAFGPLAANATSIKAYFKVSYTAYRWNKVVSVGASATNLTSADTDTVATPTVSTITTPSKSFKGAAGAAGEFASFDVSYTTTNLSSGSYTATVTITYTVE